MSPVVDNLEDSYDGYGYRNWEKINHHFGDETLLKQLVDTAHSMGLWIMADVIANHVAPVESDFSQIYPFNLTEYYHPDCNITDWGNQWMMENCRLMRLPDLD